MIEMFSIFSNVITSLNVYFALESKCINVMDVMFIAVQF